MAVPRSWDYVAGSVRGAGVAHTRGTSWAARHGRAGNGRERKGIRREEGGGGTHVEVKEDFERDALARVKRSVVAVVVP
jgi:hypothetical protein